MKLGEVIESCTPTGTDYYIVIETGYRPLLEKIEDFIIRNRVITTCDVYRPLRDIIEEEKKAIIRKGTTNV
jgi:hypothetical protein